MFEGYGGPIRMDQADLSGIDPTLESCCQREVRVLCTDMQRQHTVLHDVFLCCRVAGVSFPAPV